MIEEKTDQPKSPGRLETLEARHEGSAMAIFEFPSMNVVHAFWNSPEYEPVKDLRRGAAVLDIWAVVPALELR